MHLTSIHSTHTNLSFSPRFHFWSATNLYSKQMEEWLQYGSPKINSSNIVFSCLFEHICNFASIDKSTHISDRRCKDITIISVCIMGNKTMLYPFLCRTSVSKSWALWSYCTGTSGRARDGYYKPNCTQSPSKKASVLEGVYLSERQSHNE